MMTLMPLRRRSQLIIVSVVTLLVLGSTAFVAARSVGLLHENIAETGFRSMADDLRASGARLACDQGDPGYGPDNTSPWYKAVYAVPRSVTLPDRVMEIAAKQGFTLAELRLADSAATQKLYQGAHSNRTLTVATYRSGAVYRNGAVMSDCAGFTATRDRPMLIELSLEYPSNTTGEPAPVEAQSAGPASDPASASDAEFGSLDTTATSR